jgi:hypothetical protein
MTKSHLMKVLDVEFWSELFLSPPPQLCNLELAHLVAQRLAWPGHIPVDLDSKRQYNMNVYCKRIQRMLYSIPIPRTF